MVPSHPSFAVFSVFPARTHAYAVDWNHRGVALAMQRDAQEKDDAPIHDSTNAHALSTIGGSITSDSSKYNSVVKSPSRVTSCRRPAERSPAIQKGWDRRDRQHLESRLRKLAPVPAGPVQVAAP